MSVDTKVGQFSALLKAAPWMGVWFLSPGIMAAYAQAQTSAADEYRLKAAYLYNFASFIQWPDSGSLETDQPFIFAVIGDDPFGPYLDALASETIAGRPILVVRIAELTLLTDVDVLFVSPSQAGHMPQILNALEHKAVLTVGESGDFTARGGVIRWFQQDRRLRFEINRCAAQAAGLRISERLLRLASSIMDEDCKAGRS